MIPAKTLPRKKYSYRFRGGPLGQVTQKPHKAAPGPRPETWFKQQRAK